MKVAVVGYPNVGKTSLVNRLAGSREAVVHERPGITRDRNEIAVRVERAALHAHRHRRHGLRSTRDPIAGSIREQARPRWPTRRSRCSSSTRAPGCAPATRRSPTCCAAPTARSSSPPTRSTRVEDVPLAAEFHALGLGEPVAGLRRAGPRHRRPARPRRRAAARGRGRAEDDEDVVRLAVIGRPNVGKSLAGQPLPRRSERVIVSDVAGTTRDAIDLPLEVDGRKLVLVDTAGHAPPGEGLRVASSTTRRCARSGRPSAPTSRWSSATPTTASPRRTCASPSWR